MARKVFISVLGAGYYGECKYCRGEKDETTGRYEFESSSTRFIQQATLEYLKVKDDWTENDAAYILVTERAKEVNWNKDIDCFVTRDGKELRPYQGLEKVIEDMHLPFKAKAVNIKDGINETEIWEIFDEIVSKDKGIIQDRDELYFDLTHGFRYLPMLVLVLGNYTKFLRKTKKCSITYGNYEMKDKDGYAPIIDILPLATLQDWTFAVADYLENGYAEQLDILSKESPNPILSNKSTEKDDDAKNKAKQVKDLIGSIKNVAQERQTCRGISVIKSKKVAKLKENIHQSKHNLIKAFTPLIDKIDDSLHTFDENENVLNTIAAAKWCFDKHQYQSATTFLEEGVVSFFCKRHNIKYEDETLRGLVTGAFTLKKNNGSFQDWKIDESQIFPFLHIYYDPMLQDKDFVNIFYDFFHEVRNDYNHCGFRSKQKPLESRDIIKKIGDAISSIQQKLDSSVPMSFKEDEKPKLFLNLTNHSHQSWDKEQLDSSSKYGNIVDIAFPSIAPDDDSTAINAIVEKYTNIIKEQTDYFNVTVHIMGEMTFTYAIVSRLKALGIKCLASTTERNTIITPDGKKLSDFKFVQFREY